MVIIGKSTLKCSFNFLPKVLTDLCTPHYSNISQTNLYITPLFHVILSLGATSRLLIVLSSWFPFFQHFLTLGRYVVMHHQFGATHFGTSATHQTTKVPSVVGIYLGKLIIFPQTWSTHVN